MYCMRFAYRYVLGLRSRWCSAKVIFGFVFGSYGILKCYTAAHKYVCRCMEHAFPYNVVGCRVIASISALAQALELFNISNAHF